MPFTTGTATDYHDLLDDLRNWLVATVGWTQLRWTAPAGLTSTAELWLRGPGAGPDRQVFVGIQSVNLAASGHYGWKCKGAVSFDGGNSFDDQTSAGPAVWFNTWQNAIPYWFYGNDRRFIVVAKVGTSYISFYGGFILPFALPSEYPFPIAVIGNYTSLDIYSLVNSANRMIIDPGNNAGTYRRRNVALWNYLSNHDNSGSDSDLKDSSGDGDAVIWPHKSLQSFSSSSNEWAALDGFVRWRPNANNEFPLIQCQIWDPSQREIVGALDGAYATAGFNRTSEQVVTFGGRNFRLFQNIFRTGGKDFMAIEEV